jgi:hypothetical protein
MRGIFAVLCLSTVLLVGCETCPDGNAGDSLYCHAGNCAAGEAICAGVCSNMQTDRDNCGQCGNQCGDGLVCSGGTCVEGCDNGQVSCAGSCVDTQTDEMNCGGCGLTGPQFVCDGAETCSGGGCICAAPSLTCGGVCTDPMTNPMHCGATGDCTGGNAGTTCMSNEGCVDGGCISRLIYRGSLRASNGNWTYQGQAGLNGANAECELRWPGSKVCTYDKLLMASQRLVPETMGATDFMGNAVTAWWIDDPTALPTQRCTNNNTRNVNDPNDLGVAWTYGTQDQGHVGKFVTLTPATGAISTVTTIFPSCNTARHVACCSTVVAP